MSHVLLHVYLQPKKNKFQSQHPGQFVPRKSKHGHGNMAQMIFHIMLGLWHTVIFEKQISNHQFFLINFIPIIDDNHHIWLFNIPIHHDFVKWIASHLFWNLSIFWHTERASRRIRRKLNLQFYHGLIKQVMDKSTINNFMIRNTSE